MATKKGTPGNDLLTGTSSADTLLGLEGNDTLDAKGGNDTLDGGSGVDSMIGGNGNDLYIVDNIGDIVVESSNQGTDTVQASVSYTLSANVEKLTLTGSSNINATGNTLANTLTGNSGDNVLHGGSGNDSMSGGAGNDTYYVDSTSDSITESSGQGTDTVISTISYSLSNNFENLTLTGTAVTATGNGSNNVLSGNSVDNTLDAKGGNDTLDGGAGADSMIGGAGNDTYVVDNSGDRVTESSSGGTDTVYSSINYTLGSNLEHLNLIGGAVSGTGNSGANSLSGNSLDNMLDGKAGADSMAGGFGNDIYVVDNIGDTVSETADSGSDTVQSSISYSLGAHIENLELLNGAAQGKGNELDNLLRDNSGSNMLSAMDGNDRVSVTGGADTAYGGQGEDTLIVDYSALTAGISQQDLGNGNLIVAGASSIYSEEFEHFDIHGGKGNDTLSGGDGRDTLSGGLGDDTYYTDGMDFIIEHAGEGIDTIISSEDYGLVGGMENLQLEGAAITGIGSYDDNKIYGNANDNLLDGREGNNQIYAGEGDDTVVSGRGWDWADGGTGTDTLRIELGHDIGTNQINAFSYDGSNQYTVEISGSMGNRHVDASGFEHFEINGGSGNDVIVGSLTGETIDGGAGNDWIDGNDGNDTLRFSSGKDSIFGGAGDDSFIADFSSSVEDLLINSSSQTLTGPWGTVISASINDQFGNSVQVDGVEHVLILGGAGDDSIKGGDADESFDGGAGNDTIDAGAGDDTVIAGRGMDLASGGYGATDEDTLIADFSASGQSLSITVDSGALPGFGGESLYARIQDQFGNGVDAGNFEHIQVVGGAGDDTISGGNADELLDGGAGYNQILGNDGDDTVVGGKGITSGNGGLGTDTLRMDLRHIDENLNINAEAYPWDGSNYQYDIHAVGATDFSHATGLMFERMEILGGSGDDSVSGSIADESIDGGKGDDNLNGNGGNDTIIAGRGMDTASGGQGEDTLIVDFSTSSANLNLYIDSGRYFGPEGQSFYAHINDAFGNGVLAEGFEHIEVRTGAGNDTLNGGDADEVLDGGSGSNTVHGGNGDDTVVAGQGWDWAMGGAGIDTLRFDLSHVDQNLNINLYAYSGWDGSSYEYQLNAVGNSAYSNANGSEFEHLEVIGGTADDSISGSIAGENIDGGKGNDSIYGNEGDDTIIAGQGMDMVSGGLGEDTLIADFGASDMGLNISIDSGTVFAPNGPSLYADISDLIGNRVIADGFECIRVSGGAGNDTINGGNAGEILDGADGNDSIFGNEGNDTVIAGRGQDWAMGGQGTDTLRFDLSHLDTNLNINVNTNYLGNGSYELHVVASDPYAYSTVTGQEFEALEIVGGSGNDSIQGGETGQSMDGGRGNDTIRGSYGNDTVIAGQGVDDVDGGGALDVDTLIADFSASQDDLQIQVDSYTYTNAVGTSLSASIQDQFGNAIQAMNFEGIQVLGGAGDDTINGGSAAETLDGGFGFDRIYGGGGNDTVIAGKDGDFAEGDEGIDTLRFDLSHIDDNLNININTYEYWDGSREYQVNVSGSPAGISGNGIEFEQLEVIGGSGDDSIWGSQSGESIDGGKGNDSIQGNDGNDTIIAGRGVDSVSGGMGEDSLIADFSATSEDLILTVGSGSMPSPMGPMFYANIVDQFGNAVDAYEIEHIAVLGGSGDDSILGGAAAELLNGGAGNDSATGGYGDDTVVAGRGDDWAQGGNGNDTLRFDLSHSRDNLNINLNAMAAWNGGYDFQASAFGFSDFSNVFGMEFEHLEVIAGAGFDNISGSIVGESIDGGAGDDFINGNGGDDTIIAGQGIDEVQGGDGQDTLRFDRSMISTAQTINVNAGPYWAGGTEVTIWSYDGPFTQVRGTGFEQLEITGGSGNDNIYSSFMDERIDGAGGNDYLFAHEGNDTVVAGQGNDFADGGEGIDTLRFDLSHSSEDASVQVNTFSLGDGSYRYEVSTYGDGTPAFVSGMWFEHLEILGGSGDNFITGGFTAELFDGGTGNDTIFAGEGNDTVLASSGFDSIEGGLGEDRLVFDFSGASDALSLNVSTYNNWDGSLQYQVSNSMGPEYYGLSGRDIEVLELIGGSGRDSINGSNFKDHIDGGSGDDNIYAAMGDDTVVSGRGWDWADGSTGNDTLRFDVSHLDQEWNDIYVNAFGDDFAGYQFDVNSYGATASSHVNGINFEHLEIVGSRGNDWISGSVAGESIDGGEGFDRLIGAEGLDTLAGGSDADSFVYSSLGEGGAGEWISDFELGAGGDVLDLSGFGSFIGDAQHLSFTHVDSNNDGFTDYTAVGIDLDGGADKFVNLVNLQGVEMDWGDSANLWV